METTRIDLIALNGGDGEHYKYEEVARELFEFLSEYSEYISYSEDKEKVFKEFSPKIVGILVENFPNG